MCLYQRGTETFCVPWEMYPQAEMNEQGITWGERAGGFLFDVFKLP